MASWTFIQFLNFKRIIWILFEHIKELFSSNSVIKNIYLIIFKELLKQIRQYEKNFHIYTEKQLKLMFKELSSLNKKQIKINDYLIIIAITNELLKRTYGLRCRDTQIISSLSILYNFIIELNTGEGKTVVSILSSIIKKINKQQIHIMTVNDYLVVRDFLYAKKILNKLNINVDILLKNDTIEIRKEVYNSLILFGTPEEFAFDYLKELDDPSIVWNVKYCYVLIDEIDSILLDIAQTPLILSIKQDFLWINSILKELSKYKELIQKNLFSDENNNINYTIQFIYIIESLVITGITKDILKMSNIKNTLIIHLMNNLIKANLELCLNIDYLKQNNELQLVNKVTHRTMIGHSYSDGIQNALEIKESIPISNLSIIRNITTLPNFMKNYKDIGGYSGTILTNREHFKKIYNLDVLKIKPFYKKRLSKFNETILINNNDMYSLKKLINYFYRRKQPLLINFNDVNELKLTNKELIQTNIPHNTIDASNLDKESLVIKKSGIIQSVTLSTNVISRGTDISFGDIKNKSLVLLLGGLSLIKTKHKESNRIEKQVIGRVARKNYPGETRYLINNEAIKENNHMSTLLNIVTSSHNLIDTPLIHHSVKFPKTMKFYNDLYSSLNILENYQVNDLSIVHFIKYLGILRTNYLNKISNINDSSKLYHFNICLLLHETFENTLLTKKNCNILLDSHINHIINIDIPIINIKENKNNLYIYRLLLLIISLSRCILPNIPINKQKLIINYSFIYTFRFYTEYMRITSNNKHIQEISIFKSNFNFINELQKLSINFTDHFISNVLISYISKINRLNLNYIEGE